MSIAIDTNVLVRLLVRDDEAQFRAATALVEEAAKTGQPILILLCALLETEWVLRSRFRLDKPTIASAFTQLLESREVVFEHEATVEECLYLWAQHPTADFADCLLLARATQMGRVPFMTFDAGAARLPGAELLA